MPRFIFRLKNASFGPKDAKEILQKSRKLLRDVSMIVMDCRVSSRDIELDITCPVEKKEDVMRALSAIAVAEGIDEITERKEEKFDAIERGKKLFAEQRHWEAHEALEGAWRKSEGDEKEILQGVILILAALVHAQKDENAVCFSILKRALEKLAGKTGSYHGIELEELYERVERALKKGDIGKMTLGNTAK